MNKLTFGAALLTSACLAWGGQKGQPCNGPDYIAKSAGDKANVIEANINMNR